MNATFLKIPFALNAYGFFMRQGFVEKCWRAHLGNQDEGAINVGATLHSVFKSQRIYTYTFVRHLDETVLL